ncbi:MAG: ThuA domain-containing protein [Granulosicoccus sp.]|nr:ThuA domain-containing protein [Granulosicoccus sp.]
MNLRQPPLTRFVISLAVCVWVVSACSGSESDSAGSDATQVLSDSDDMTDAENPITNDEVPGDATFPLLDPVVPPDNSSVADPLIQNSTRVKFDITVPAYQSDALQVNLTWGELGFTAAWIGDEFWSVAVDLPTDTAHSLTVTFSDNNGAITLASVESEFKTGTNASESFDIFASQFDTSRWDDDNDGVSNIDELIAGTYHSGSPRALLFSETRGFRHESIQHALDTVEELAMSAGIQSDRAGDSMGVFTDENLARYDAVVWVLTSGDVLDDAEQTVFERYIRAGGAYAGIHAASDTEYDWPWYGGLVGAYFANHPEIQSARQIVEDSAHPSTSHLGSTWVRTDEWYDYRSNPRGQVNVLLRLDEQSYAGGGMGEDHPSAWYHEYEGGRSWYTGGGHTIESYSEPEFRIHLLGGLRYAVGVE